MELNPKPSEQGPCWEARVGGGSRGTGVPPRGMRKRYFYQQEEAGCPVEDSILFMSTIKQKIRG